MYQNQLFYLINEAQQLDKELAGLAPNDIELQRARDSTSRDYEKNLAAIKKASQEIERAKEMDVTALMTYTGAVRKNIDYVISCNQEKQQLLERCQSELA